MIIKIVISLQQASFKSFAAHVILPPLKLKCSEKIFQLPKNRVKENLACLPNFRINAQKGAE